MDLKQRLKAKIQAKKAERTKHDLPFSKHIHKINETLDGMSLSQKEDFITNIISRLNTMEKEQLMSKLTPKTNEQVISRTSNQKKKRKKRNKNKVKQQVEQKTGHGPDRIIMSELI